MKFPKVQPKNKEELESIIEKAMSVLGNEADLNFIDTSKVTDMSGLFFFSKFNGNISYWDTSNVTDMTLMFANSFFNGDIFEWDVSNVENMDKMFYGSYFNGDISKWDISNVKKHLQFNQDSKLEDKNCPKFNK